MRRTVKAWVYETRGDSFWQGLDSRNFFKRPTCGRSTPVVITYDDGRPAPKRRTRTARKGGKRG